MHLGEICQFQTGFTARGRLNPLAEGGRLALQLRDLRDDGSIDGTGVQRFDIDGLPERYTVEGGDVVFRSRGQPNLAYAVPEGMLEPVVALLPLIILRPRGDRITPEYLTWAINQPEAQRQIDAEAQGTGLRMIPKTSLEGVVIPVPDINTQRLIVEVAELAAKETALLHLLAERRNVLTGRVLADLAQAGAQQKGLWT